jgi:hypothetical protein
MESIFLKQDIIYRRFQRIFCRRRRDGVRGCEIVFAMKEGSKEKEMLMLLLMLMLMLCAWTSSIALCRCTFNAGSLLNVFF